MIERYHPLWPTYLIRAGSLLSFLCRKPRLLAAKGFGKSTAPERAGPLAQSGRLDSENSIRFFNNNLHQILLRLVLVVAVVNASLLPQAAQSGSHGFTAGHSWETDSHESSGPFEMGQERLADHGLSVAFSKPFSHDHNPADHSHDIPLSSELAALRLALIDRGPEIRAMDLCFPGRLPCLERPPQPLG